MVTGETDDRPRFLIEDHSVIYANSITLDFLLARSSPSERTAPARLLAVGDPEYQDQAGEEQISPSEEQLVETLLKRAGLSLDPLPFSRQEVETVAGYFEDSVTLLGPEAGASDHQWDARCAKRRVPCSDWVRNSW